MHEPYIRHQNADTESPRAYIDNTRLWHARMMSDKEIPEYFKSKLLKSNVKHPDVRPIPEGEPVFIMNIFKGRTRPLLAFIDSGCNCWVAKEGVPQRELISAKLRDGPIKVGVASGIIVNASGGW